MLFTSFDFALFVIVVFTIYWLVLNRNLKFQNLFLLLAGYFFYAYWDWRFLGLLLLISLFNYFLGLGLTRKPEIIKENELNEATTRASEQLQKRRRLMIILGVVLNIGILGVFKYFNFFIDSFIDLMALTGYELPRVTLRLILPLGISFYTFLSLSYIIDVYKGTLIAEKNPVNTLLTLSFFPIIFAGPIQRPASLLPQITIPRTFSYDLATDGLRQILWGLFAKLVIADQLAPYIGELFSNHAEYNGSTLFIGIVFFTIQIYADFSGYSNIAIGVGKLFGFSLMQNFNYPYFGRDITEFWKRWHISLTTWFRDYFFMPVSFSISYRLRSERVLGMKSDQYIYLMASLFTWLLTGLWHGANYTFMIWGMINGLFLVVYHFQKKPRKKLFKKWNVDNNNRWLVAFETLFTLVIVMLSWVFFRAASLSDAISYISLMLSDSLFSIPRFPGLRRAMIPLVWSVLFFVIEWRGRQSEYPLSALALHWVRYARYAFYYVLLILIFLFGGTHQGFIYFQF